MELLVSQNHASFTIRLTFLFSISLVYGYFQGYLLESLAGFWKLPLLGAITFGIYLTLAYIRDNYFLKDATWYGFHKISISRRYIFGQLWRALLFMGFGGFYFLFRRYVTEIEVRKKAEREHYQSLLTERDLALQLEKAKNSYLKA